jgi:hypothetical protein
MVRLRAALSDLRPFVDELRGWDELWLARVCNSRRDPDPQRDVIRETGAFLECVEDLSRTPNMWARVREAMLLREALRQR